MQGKGRHLQGSAAVGSGRLPGARAGGSAVRGAQTSCVLAAVCRPPQQGEMTVFI